MIGKKAAMRARAKRLIDEIAQAALRDFRAGLKDLDGAMPPDLVVYGSYARDEAQVQHPALGATILQSGYKDGNVFRRVRHYIAPRQLGSHEESDPHRPL